MLDNFYFNTTSGGGNTAPCSDAVDWFIRGGGGYTYRVTMATALNVSIATVGVSSVTDSEGRIASVPDSIDLDTVNAAVIAPIPLCSTGDGGGGTRMLRSSHLSASGLGTTLSISTTLSVLAADAAALAASVSALNATAVGNAFEGELPTSVA